ncbi:hypothetical protein [Flavisolibacter ginsengisoli]|jgi:hypothetical protein|uniref:Uncharacterized protein n=1 Tax=Flavisolibacter ginsengisoli DSM 18119 TaxID=1121884 RepID=A0A1M5CPM8_9BACT|nr:hypothetical protein [Flavisolibacter ginsengisoli]SHF56653.1 hypothetical protein SAMN02745131_02970 [Flavisolibacter ginsengisoli DSM 18119]
MKNPSQHSFHIPVMGLAYTIDSPIKVARFGIGSAISIVEDRLIELMRSHYYSFINEVYIPIPTSQADYRAKRITDYLNLVNKIVLLQIERIRNSAFEAGSEIVKYFELLPESNPLKQIYNRVNSISDLSEKMELESYLRSIVIPGSIDVNIMTKIDKNNYSKNGDLLEDGSDAITALKGYANSDLSNSSVIFSAGMNPRLYNYLEKCNEFQPDKKGVFQKKIIVKVSDYRSALIQSKYLAKKGIWVSEFRIESGLNCGGHAFATDGFLMGPILEEFKSRKEELVKSVFEIYKSALEKKGLDVPGCAPAIAISVQGGIGTAEEDAFLHQYYNVDSTGWGTPFLLVPEATTVDEATLKLLCNAKQEDVLLSNNSPLGVRFHYLNGTTSHSEKLERIKNGKPGSPCTEKHLEFNTEFTEKPICTASFKYQKLKISQLDKMGLPEIEYQKQLKSVVDKECLCIGLSNAAAINYDKTLIKNLDAVTICPGPNIIYFTKKVSLQTMTDHIYGRTDLLEGIERPHMFINELNLYVNYLDDELSSQGSLDDKKVKFYTSFIENLMTGIAYYHNINESQLLNDSFNHSLQEATMRIQSMRKKMEMASSKNLLYIRTNNN